MKMFTAVARTCLLVLLCSSLCHAAASDNAPTPAAKIAAMEKLRFLEGNWVGSGWMSFGPNQKMEFTSTEKVHRRLGGTVMVVEGQHRAGDRVVHDALGIFSYDDAKDAYQFQTYLGTGREGRFTVELVDGGLQWGFENPQIGRMRYTILVTANGQWNEVGEISRDGGSTWAKVMEMTLTRE